MSTFVGNGGKLDELGYTRLLDELFSPGFAIRTPGAWKVTQSGAGAMQVVVGQGAGLIEYGTTYTYPAWSDSDTTIGVTAADATNPRKDRVVAYIDLSLVLTSVTNNPGALKFLAVAGTPGSSPALPNDAAVQSAVGAANPWIELARLDVAANETAILTTHITQIRSSVGLRAPRLQVITSHSANYTGSLADDYEQMDAAAAARTYTFPDATRQVGRTITVEKSDTSTNKVTCNTVLGQTIDGLSSLILPRKGSLIEAMSDGTNWKIIRLKRHAFKFQAYRPPGTTPLTAGVPTKMPLSGELYDYGEYFDAATNYRFTAPLDGLYRFSAAASSGTNIGANRRDILYLYKNGAAIKFLSQLALAGGDPFGGTGSADVELAAGDYVELYCSSSVGNQVDGDANGVRTYLSGHLVWE